MPAADEWRGVHRRPASENLQGRNSGHWPELAQNGSVANDPELTLATVNYRIAKGSFALAVGRLMQTTFA